MYASNPLRPVLLGLLVAMVTVPAALSADSPHQDPESPAAKEKRLKWFRHDKFGLLIHWGLCAIPAGYWKGERAPTIDERVMYLNHCIASEIQRSAESA